MLGMFRKAVREEAAPVARQLAEVRGLANQTNRRIQALADELLAERNARVDDLALLVELISSGWKAVDERLGRLEQTLGDAPAATVYPLDQRKTG